MSECQLREGTMLDFTCVISIHKQVQCTLIILILQPRNRNTERLSDLPGKPGESACTRGGCLTTEPTSFPYTCCLLIRTLFLQRGETTSPNSHSSSVDSSEGLTLQSQLSLSLVEVHSVAFTGAGVCSVGIHACVQLCARAHPGVRCAVM